MSASDAKLAAESVSKKIMGLRTDEEFDTFWEAAVLKAQQLQISDPVLPRIRRPPKRMDSGSEPVSYPSPKDYFRRIYFEFADNIHNEITKRFDQEHYHLYLKAEKVLLSAASNEEVPNEDFQNVCAHFGNDFDHSRLKHQLAVLSDAVDGTNLSVQDVKTSLLTLNTTSRLFSEVLRLIQLLYVVPASTATAERTFSSLRRLKTFLRNSMSQQRLNHLILLHVHKDLTDQLDLCKVAAEFIARKDRRKQFFGNIS